MTEHTNPSLMAHVSIGTNDFEKAVEFYYKVLGVLGAHRIIDFPGAVAWGKQFPEFWVQLPFDGAAAQKANGTHFAFLADSTDDVDKFHAAGLAADASDDGLPGPESNTARPTTAPFFVTSSGIK